MPEIVSKLQLALALVLILCVVIVIANHASSTKKIRVIYTNDLMGWLEPCG